MTTWGCLSISPWPMPCSTSSLRSAPRSSSCGDSACSWKTAKERRGYDDPIGSCYHSDALRAFLFSCRSHWPSAASRLLLPPARCRQMRFSGSGTDDCWDGRLQPRVFLFRNTVGERQALSDCRVCLCYQPDGNPCNHRSSSGSWRKALEADGGKTTMIWQLDLMILTLVVICALVAINIKDLLGASVVFGIYSFLMCLLWAEMGAVDVAFTEATVGAGVSTIFFIAAILRTTRRSRD